MKRYIPYIIAAPTGFFFSFAVCAANGLICYAFSWRDIVMAALACVIVWCWRGEDGIWANIRETCRRLCRALFPSKKKNRRR